jgi:polysaccharide biosynthesis protein PslJ
VQQLSEVSDLPSSNRWRHRHIDAGTLLRVYVVCLFLIPSTLIIAPLGGAGTPAGVFGLLLLAWWCCCRMVPRLWNPSYQPVRIALLLLLLAVVASYIQVGLHPMEPLEIRSADRGMLRILSFTGVALVAADGLRDRAQLRRLLRVVLLCSSLVATFGLLQYYAGLDLVQYIRIPGLSSNGELVSIAERSNLRRVAGTTAHPLEFGVVMAVVLGLALHWLLNATHRRPRHYGCVFLLALASVLSGSRAATLGILVILVTLYAGWEPSRRRAALLVLPVAVVLIRLAAPGVLGTIVSLFLNAGSDDSVAGRTDDYAVVAPFLAENPAFGRGFGTFMPELHVVLDNQYLATLVESGLVGLVSLFALFGVAWCCARGGRRLVQDGPGRHLGQTLAACIAACAVTAVTFDAFAFPVYFGLLSLLVGCAGAWWRIARQESLTAPPFLRASEAQELTSGPTHAAP